jgi:hypothetical protein
VVNQLAVFLDTIQLMQQLLPHVKNVLVADKQPIQVTTIHTHVLQHAAIADITVVHSHITIHPMTEIVQQL